MLPLEEKLQALEKRVAMIEKRLEPKRTGDSELLKMQKLIDLLVDELPSETIDMLLAKMRNEKEGFCDFCFEDEGHRLRCPVEGFRSARDMQSERS